MLQPQVQYLSDAEVDIDTDEEDDMEDYVGESGSDSEDEGRQNGAAEQAEPLKGGGSQRRAAAPGHRAPAKRRAGARCGWVCERPCRAEEQMSGWVVRGQVQQHMSLDAGHLECSWLLQR